ncbi:MAG: CDP-glycerol glycerophosphotransferase family protein [Fidelibacterota bacterium]
MSLRTSIYYYANQVYEYSFARLIYGHLGGIFVVRKPNRKLRLQWFLRKSQRVRASSPMFQHPPEILVKDVNHEPFDLPGILISNSNTVILRNEAICKTVFMGHGTGDKKYGGKASDLNTFDYHFVSGLKHLQKMEDLNVQIPEERLIKIGNCRFDEIINHEVDVDGYRNYLGIQDNNRKTILYAPTWKWGDGTLLRYGKQFAQELTGEFNLIIRPHYFDRKYISGFKAWARFRGIKHLYFSNPANILTNDTMYDFAVSDLLLSDTSSILYEYLIVNRPIVVIKNKFDDLHAMPPELDVNTIASHYDGNIGVNIITVIYNALENHDPKAYETMLNNCFYFNDGKSVRRISNFLESLK